MYEEVNHYIGASFGHNLNLISITHCPPGTFPTMSCSRPYEQILGDWNERVKLEPEWVFFEAELMLHCGQHDETPPEVLILALVIQARALVMQGSINKALQTYQHALDDSNLDEMHFRAESLAWIIEANHECEDLRKLGQWVLSQIFTPH